MGASNGLEHLADVIAGHLRTWEPDPPHVELAIFGHGEAGAIAAAIDRLCREHLGAGAARGLFYQSSIGSVCGLALSDGRRVVVKAHQPGRSVAGLAEIVRIQRHLAAEGLFAPPIVTGPAPLGHGQAVVEEFIEAGGIADAHRPEIRTALARGLHGIVAACEGFVATARLDEVLLAPPEGSLWPTPHSKLFDFEATRQGAEWIDALAEAARAAMTPAGRIVIGHSDWRQEHVHFVEDRPVAAFDWDSLCRAQEPILLGIVTHAFCADWSKRNRAQAPTVAEARAFIAAYEEARGTAFSAAERRFCAAHFVYAVAYAARCGHARGQDQRARPGSFQHLLWQERAGLLDAIAA